MTIESVALIVGASLSALPVASSSTNGLPDVAHVVITAGLGGIIAWVLLKHFLAEQKRTVDRLAQVEDTMLSFAQQMAKTVAEFTSEIRVLVKASDERGLEVREMLASLAKRPCILHHHDEDNNSKRK